MRLWKVSLFVGLGVAVLVLAAVLVLHDAEAKGGAVGVSPDAGELGTEVELESADWPANTEVRIFSGFTTELYDERPIQYAGPIATARSDGNGDWRARLQIESLPELALPNEPGFVFFRADSDDLPLYLENSNVGYFVLTVDGRRPQGAGEINVSILVAQGSGASLGVFGWRGAGEPYFSSPYSVVTLPFETTIPGLGDGDWEIAAIAGGTLEPIGDGTHDVGDTLLCFNPQCAADTPILTVHRAKRVTVRDGQVVEAKLVLGPVGAAHEGRADAGRTFSLVAGSGLAFLSLIGGGELIRRRLSTS